MPIIVQQPPLNGPFGVGFTVTVNWDEIGPVLDPGWRITLFAADNETLIAQDDVSVPDPHGLLNHVLGDGKIPIPGGRGYAQGLDGHLLINLNSSGSSIASTSVPVHLDTTTGQAYVLAKSMQTGVVGGFTETDRQQLQTTNASTQVAFQASDGLGVVLKGLGELFNTPLNNMLQRSAESILLSGRGSLERPAGGGRVDAMGAFYGFDTVPDMFGLRDGVPPIFEQRIFQFSVIRRDLSNAQYFATLADVRSDGQEVVWGGPAPDRIDYDVTPGCVVNWRWLLLPFFP